MSTWETPGNGYEWQQVAGHLHAVLGSAGVDMPLCGPKTPGDCGHTWAEHALSYAAALQAWAESNIEHIHHGEPAVLDRAALLLEHWRTVMRRDFDCTTEDH